MIFPYSYPEEADAQIVAEYDAYDASYSFDYVILVRDLKDGKLYVAQDSGCSCPTPFENHTWPTDFAEVRTWDEVKRFVDNEYPPEDDEWRPRQSVWPFRMAVTEALGEKYIKPTWTVGRT